LLIRTSAFGDVVQTYYVISDLKNVFPDLKIDWCVDERFFALAKLHSGIERIIRFPSRRWRKNLLQLSTWQEVWRWLRDLRRTRYDIALDLQGVQKSALIGQLSRSRIRIGYDRRAVSEFGVHLLYHRRVPGREGGTGLATGARYLAGSGLGYDPGRLVLDSGLKQWVGPEFGRTPRVCGSGPNPAGLREFF
jgi:heptosyltransferase-1